jgi:hypothetical protein
MVREYDGCPLYDENVANTHTHTQRERENGIPNGDEWCGRPEKQSLGDGKMGGKTYVLNEKM